MRLTPLKSVCAGSGTGSLLPSLPECQDVLGAECGSALRLRTDVWSRSLGG